MAEHKNPFAAPEMPSMADLLNAVGSDENLDPARASNVRSSLRRFAELLEMKLEQMPAQAGYYRHMIKDLHPQQLGITPRRWGNIKSDVLWAIKHYGGEDGTDGRLNHLSQFTPAWEALNQNIGNDRVKWELSRFLRYLSAQDIAPSDVTDEVAHAFYEALVAESFVDDPKDRLRRTIKSWNTAADTVVDWPKTKLTRLKGRETYTLPWSAFPLSLQKEVEQWLDALSGTDLLNDDHVDRPLKPRTIETREFQLRQYVSALVHRGHPIENLISFSIIVDVNMVKDGLRFFLERSNDKPTSQIQSIAGTLCAVAKHQVKVNEEHLTELKRLHKKVTPRSDGLTVKNRDRLRQFDDPQNMLALLDFPRRYMQKALREKPNKRSTAVMAQIALAVEFLLFMPIRAENLAGISLKHHILRTRSPKAGVVHLVIPADEVKNREHLEFELPKEAVQMLDQYLEHFRPRLMDEESEWLFPGQDGDHKTRSVLSSQISKAVFKETGLKVHTHLFRHIGTKFYLDEHPGGYEVVRRVLAHRDMNTTTRIYAGLEAASAARHFDRAILNRRNDLRCNHGRLEE